MAIWFNKKLAKAWGKRKFISEFKGVYPEADLAKEFDKLVPPKKTDKADQEPTTDKKD